MDIGHTWILFYDQNFQRIKENTGVMGRVQAMFLQSCYCKTPLVSTAGKRVMCLWSSVSRFQVTSSVMPVRGEGQKATTWVPARLTETWEMQSCVQPSIDRRYWKETVLKSSMWMISLPVLYGYLTQTKYKVGKRHITGWNSIPFTSTVVKTWPYTTKTICVTRYH